MLMMRMRMVMLMKKITAMMKKQFSYISCMVKGSDILMTILINSNFFAKVVKERMAGWFSRLFYPYRLLLLFSLIVCLVQVSLFVVSCPTR